MNKGNKKTTNLIHSICILFGVLLSKPLISSNEIIEINIMLPKTSKVSWKSSKSKNSLTIILSHVYKSELEKFSEYQSSLINRVIIRERNDKQTQITINKKDKSTEFYIDTLQSPYRLHLVIYKDTYKPSSDKVTGLPLYTENISDVKSNLLNKEIEITKEQKTTSPIKEKKYRLVAPSDKVKKLSTSSELVSKINKVKSGKGYAWTSFPEYIYPLQNSLVTTSKDGKEGANRVKSKFEEDISNLANLATNYFTYGDYNKSFEIYNAIQKIDQSLFLNNPDHNWRYAETLLGQGNYALSKTYYKNIITIQPGEDLAKYARIRLLDIKSINILKAEKPQMLGQLVDIIDKISTENNDDLKAHKIIRKAFWSQTKSLQNTSYIPLVEGPDLKSLKSIYNKTQSETTGFISHTILVSSLLKDKSGILTSNKDDLTEYLRQFGKSDYARSKTITKKIKNSLYDYLTKIYNEGKYLDFISHVESLPKIYSENFEASDFCWQLGYAYNTVENYSLALENYRKCDLESYNDNNKYFKLNLYLLELMTKVGKSPETYGAKKQSFSKSDSNLYKTWDKLESVDKTKSISEHASTIYYLLKENKNLKAPSLILLEHLKEDETKKPSSNDPLIMKNKIEIIDLLISSFKNLELNTEYKESRNLMTNVKVTESNTVEEKSIWSERTIELAEEYRDKKMFRKSGDLYLRLAEMKLKPSQTAELYYKSGLLLYRSGNKEKSLESFEKASQDNNNFFYANLAKERIKQLQ